jgi:hypothetical protein
MVKMIHTARQWLLVLEDTDEPSHKGNTRVIVDHSPPDRTANTQVIRQGR